MKQAYPLTIFMLLFIFPLCIKSQSIEKSILNSAGSTQPNDQIVLSSSIGEVFVGFLQSPDNGIFISSGYFSALELNSLYTDNFKDEQFTVYPNPFTEKITIHSNLRDYQMSIYNMQGVTIFTANSSLNNEYYLNMLQTGVYILQIQDKKTNKKFQHKLIKK